MAGVRPGFVAVGRVLAPRGLHGELKVQPLAETPEYLAPGRELYLAGQRRVVERCQWHSGLAYVKLQGIENRQAAEVLRGEFLELAEEELQPLGQDEYYRYQLLEMSVRTTEGAEVGRVADVLATPANDVLIVRAKVGEVLIPMVGEIIKNVDMESRCIIIEALPGLFPPSHPPGKSFS